MKKGQVYILAAIILTVIIYGMVTIVNKVSQETLESDFEELSTNYANEGSKLINDVLATGDKDLVIQTFKDYTRSFTAYAKTKSTDFGLIYAFYYTSSTSSPTSTGRLYVGNYMNIPMLISYTPDSSNSKYVEGCYSNIDASVGYDGIRLDTNIDSLGLTECEKILPPDPEPEASINTVYITIGGYGYRFDINPDELEVIIVSREDRPEQRKVFIEGDLTQDMGTDFTSFSDYCTTGQTTSICEGTRLQCSRAYQTKDDCTRDTQCRWSETANECQNI